jgi:exodeoxyribonuclease VII large subunit
MESPTPSISAISLSDLNRDIRHALHEYFTKGLWIIAEISEIKINTSGHCYLELIEKDTTSNKILAKARANIWAYSFRLLKPYFETTARRILEAGIKVMVFAQVEFHEVYGLSLNITDIDPTYTLGDMAKQRAEAIARLQTEGVFEMNKNLELPVVVQKIAVISSSTAAGYEDFCQHLLKNDYGFFFNLKLFPAIMQGEEAVESIIAALDKIHLHLERYETVVIIRGGGSQLDLSCFDSYWLASNVAQFPLPVLTGIGHEQDESVTDLVAHGSMKTPTAVADFLISKSIEFEGYLHELKSQFTDLVQKQLSDENSKLMVVSIKFGPRIHSILQKREKLILSLFNDMRMARQKFHRKSASRLEVLKYQSSNSSQIHINRLHQKLTFLHGRFKPLLHAYLKTQNSVIQSLNELANTLNPENVLKRGFSITYHQGKVLRNSSISKPGDIIESRLEKGSLKSKITDTSEISKQKM